MAFLRVVSGAKTGQLWELPESKAVLGWHPDCLIEINTPGASRHHAQIVFHGNAFFVEDLHSRNGTFVNDRQIQLREKLNDGDHIRIAEFVFKFCQGNYLASGAGAVRAEQRPEVILDDGVDFSGKLAFSAKPAGHSSVGTNRSNASLQTQLQGLLEITQNLRKAISLEQVMPQILESLFTIFPQADRGIIVLRGDDGELVPRWVKLRHADTREGYGENRISRTVIERAMGSQDAILSADVLDDLRFASSTSLASISIRSLMCVPLIDGEGRSFGAIQLDTVQEQDRFHDEELDVFLNVAMQASIAIDNARLHEFTLRQRALERELELAHQIQRGFLPQSPPELPGYEFFSHYQPANRVGGDFYDYIPLMNGRIAIAIADVVGHGLAAAMCTAKLAGELRLRLMSASSPAEAITQLNSSLVRDLIEDHFITLAVAVLSPATGEVTLINAGHMPPILRRAAGRAGDIISGQGQLPLGVVDGTVYDACTLRLTRGNVLMLYTDGVNEAINQAEEMYGMERIRQRGGGAGTPRQVGRGLLDDIRGFVQGAPQRDDLCLVCFGPI